MYRSSFSYLEVKTTNSVANTTYLEANTTGSVTNTTGSVAYS